MVWKPNVTVAAVVEVDQRFLLVEEETEAGLQLNQPAGHLEPGESLIEATVREALEETAYHVLPQSVVGVYLWPHPLKDLTYLRVALRCQMQRHEPARVLDQGIVRAVWLTLDEVRASQHRHRSPLVLRCIEDALAGPHVPLSVLVDARPGVLGEEACK